MLIAEGHAVTSDRVTGQLTGFNNYGGRQFEMVSYACIFLLNNLYLRNSFKNFIRLKYVPENQPHQHTVLAGIATTF
jgi:hypothetical protein